MINIGLCGSTGKMGQMIIQKIDGLDSCKISATFSQKNQIEDFIKFCQNSDVIIDFSNSEILDKLLDYAEIYQNKLIIGTTGLLANQFARLNKLSKKLAILYSTNMSLGANLLAILSEQVAQILDKSYNIEIQECHHRMKKDAPSGTAIMLGKAVAKARNLDFDQVAVYDRSLTGQRLESEIGITAVRGGMVHGEHQILFLGDDEILSLKHQALNKASFADGAILAALWIFDKPAGMYSMRNVLNLKINDI